MVYLWLRSIFQALEVFRLAISSNPELQHCMNEQFRTAKRFRAQMSSGCSKKLKHVLHWEKSLRICLNSVSCRKPLTSACDRITWGFTLLLSCPLMSVGQMSKMNQLHTACFILNELGLVKGDTRLCLGLQKSSLVQTPHTHT